MNITYDNAVVDRSKERLASLPIYPSNQNMYYNWKHDSFERSKNTKLQPLKAFVRSASNHNNV